MARRISGELAELREASLLRSLRTAGPRQQPEIVCDGRHVTGFSSNDYLGFAADPLVVEALKEAVDRFGAGAGASRLVCGTFPAHDELEAALADLKRTAAAVTFSSGYATATGAIPAVVRRGDHVVLDKLCHASLIDGAKLSGATIRVYRHNDIDMLDRLLRRIRAKAPADARVLVVTESVFSMDGDRAPLGEIADLRDRYGTLLLVDEAHAFGVFGHGGRGLADALGVADRVDLHLGTLSKAVGLQGGYLCGSRELADLIVNRARSFVFSTAPPPAVAATAARVVRDWLPGEEGDRRRRRLQDGLARVAAGLGNRIGPIQSAIVPLTIGPEEAALEVARRLLDLGFLIPAIRYPSVARGSARLRLTVTASHSPEQIDRMCEAVADVLPAAGVVRE